METIEMLEKIKDIMSMIDDCPDQQNNIDEDLARKADQTLSDIYVALEDFEDAIDPGHYFRDEMALKAMNNNSENKRWSE